MEFFATAAVHTTALELQRRLAIRDFPRWCAAVSEVSSDEGARGEIYCVWGRFRVHREDIREGVRFTLPGCPNALQWTITTGQAPEPTKVVVHLTINRGEHDPDFVDSMRQFVADWRAGLEGNW